MKKYIDDANNILGLTPFKKGFVLALKKPDSDGKFKVAYYGYDAEADEFVKIKRSVYLKIKFGDNAEKIAEALGDYVSCDSAFLFDGRVMAVFENGEYSIFNQDGSLAISSLLSYHENRACSIAPDDFDKRAIWCAVPDDNSVVKYSPLSGKILLRVGGKESTAFAKPVSLFLMDGDLYICNSISQKIRVFNPMTNKIRDYRVFEEPVLRYVNALGHEFVLLRSGLFEID